MTKLRCAALCVALIIGYIVSPFLALERESGDFTFVARLSSDMASETPPSSIIHYLRQRRLSLVIDWARTQIGSRAYNGYCQRFVRVAYEAGGFSYRGDAFIGCARDAYHTFSVEKWAKGKASAVTKAHIPIGATLYFDTGRWGHSAIVTNKYWDNGEVVLVMVHAVSRVEEIEVDDGWWSKSIGWGWQGRNN